MIKRFFPLVLSRSELGSRVSSLAYGIPLIEAPLRLSLFHIGCFHQNWRLTPTTGRRGIVVFRVTNTVVPVPGTGYW